MANVPIYFINGRMTCQEDMLSYYTAILRGRQIKRSYFGTSREFVAYVEHRYQEIDIDDWNRERHKIPNRIRKAFYNAKKEVQAKQVLDVIKAIKEASHDSSKEKGFY